MLNFEDYENRGIKFDENRGRAIRRMAKKALTGVEILIEQSKLPADGNILDIQWDQNMLMLESELEIKGIPRDMAIEVIDYCYNNNKVCIHLTTRVWSFTIMGIVESLFKPRTNNDLPWIIAEVFMKAVSGDYNWWHRSKREDDALLLVDKEACSELIGLTLATLKGMKKKRGLTEEEYKKYGKVIWSGYMQELEEIQLNTVKVETI